MYKTVPLPIFTASILAFLDSKPIVFHVLDFSDFFVMLFNLFL